MNSPTKECNFTSHDRAEREKLIAQNAHSTFGYVLYLTSKNLQALFSRFQILE
jgi:hypothetical protein